MSDVDRRRRRNLLAVGQAMLAGCAVTEEQHLAHEPKARGTQTPFGTTETADAPSSVVTPELAAHLDPNRVPKRMLALDGGGLRGVFTLEFLDSMEAELRRRTGNNALLLRDYFDLIGGTSTGSIIAAALACGMSVATEGPLCRVGALRLQAFLAAQRPFHAEVRRGPCHGSAREAAWREHDARKRAGAHGSPDHDEATRYRQPVARSQPSERPLRSAESEHST